MLKRICFWKTSSNLCHAKYVYITNAKYKYIYKIFRAILIPRMLKGGPLRCFHTTEKLISNCYHFPHAWV